MTGQAETSEARVIRKLTGGDPKRQVFVGALAIPVPVGIIGLLMLVFLEFEASGAGFSSLLSAPRNWIPEFAIWALTLAYTAVGVMVAMRLNLATQVHSFRAVGSAIMAAALFDAGFRMLANSLTGSGLLFVATGVLLSLLTQAYGIRSVRTRMERALNKGSLGYYLDRREWTWDLQKSFAFEIDEEDRQANKLASRISKLHWLAPAIGLFIARTTAGDQTLLVFGAMYAFIGLILSGGFMRELGVVLQLREWGREAGRPIQLK